MRIQQVYSGVMLLLLSSLNFPSDLPAQESQELRREVEQVIGRPLSDQEILRQIRQTGLSPDEIRNRLERGGYARNAADAYLAILEGRAEQVPEGTDPMPLVEVLAELEGSAERPLGRIPTGRPLALTPRSEPPGPPIFGRELFRRVNSQFAPIASGPVPPDYRLGPSDELVLVITGGVEQAYQLTVTREGWIVIPDVGRILVNGLTLENLEEVLFNRLSEVYSGIDRGPDATTFFDVSLGKLRTNQIFVIGEVEEPAAYQVSSLATTLTALYWAGGPGVNGSFRAISVNRGNRTVAEIDLYEYLLRGRVDQNVRLEHGDVIFVPVAGTRVQLDGAVERPGIYEVKDGEGLRDLIRFAGGTQAMVDLRHVQIQRILPPTERTPGRDRAVIDLPLDDPEQGGEFIALRDGDQITVFAVLTEIPNQITISGGVWRPGTYGAESGMRLWDLIERAGGLLPDAYVGRAQIQRLQSDQTRSMIQVNLEVGPGGVPLENPAIEGMDQVFLFAKRDLRDERVVSIVGWVNQPGVQPFVDGMTVRDLILKAGGVRTGAFLGNAEVSRLVISQAFSDTLIRRFQIPLDSSYVFTSTSGPARIDTERAEFVLQDHDVLTIRRSPGFVPQQSVTITGMVLLPGPYSLETRGERLTDLVQRAGGLTPDAYAAGVQLWRSTGEISGEGPQLRVGIDFEAAMNQPGGSADVLLEANDRIVVPRYNPLVQVRGAVGVESQILYKRGAGLGYYIDQSGGYAKNAEKSLTRVVYASGKVQTRGKKFLFFGGGVSDPDPGSVITVPVKAESEGGGIKLSEMVGVLTAVMTAAATVIIASQ